VIDVGVGREMGLLELLLLWQWRGVGSVHERQWKQVVSGKGRSVGIRGSVRLIQRDYSGVVHDRRVGLEDLGGLGRLQDHVCHPFRYRVGAERRGRPQGWLHAGET